MRYLIAILLLCVSYPALAVTYFNPQETTVNQWLIEPRQNDGKLQLSLRMRRDRDGRSSNNHVGFGIALDQLTGLTREQMMSSSGTSVKFELRRDAGTFHMEGWFKEGNGSGHFTFTPNSSFAADLSRQGFTGNASADQLQSLAMSDVGSAFINELKAQGYDTATVEQLVKMGHHGVKLEYLLGLKSLGYTVKTTDLVVRMKDHGVSVNFIKELASLGYSNLTTDELVRAKDHGVTPKFIAEIREFGYDQLLLDELRRMKDHGVNGTFIKELKDLGYSNLAIQQLIRLKDHGVNAGYIRRMKEKGYGDLSIDEYIRLKNRGERE